MAAERGTSRRALMSRWVRMGGMVTKCGEASTGRGADGGSRGGVAVEVVDQEVAHAWLHCWVATA